MFSEWLQSHPLSAADLKHIIIPPATQRKFWDAVPDDVRMNAFYEIEKLVGTPWPQITATQILAFDREGNRSVMEGPYFAKRARLTRLVIAECIEHEGRFFDEIANGLLKIAEEAFWGVSAHYPHYDYLEEDERPLYIDLFAAETANLIAWTKYLLHDELIRNAPDLLSYLNVELDRRIKTPFLKHTEFWWMGYDRSKRKRLNNWTPWITSNVLTVFLLNESDGDRKIKAVTKCMEILDHYVHDLPADGGCDEGPSYWCEAGGALLECLWLFDRASGGKIVFYDDPLLHKVANYIRLVHIGSTMYINYNDGSGKVSVPPELLWNFGQRGKDRTLCAFASGLTKITPLFYSLTNLHHFLRALPYIEEMRSSNLPFVGERDAYFRDLQIVVAREHANDNGGFFFSCKGHHNGESHNHNDVGTYILYRDGVPLIIDLGSGTYTKKTFSDQRYELETCQSNWHNLPIVNGVGERAGEDACARNFTYRPEGSQIGVSMDLQNAYAREAGMESMTRQMLFDRGETPSLTVHDTFRFAKDVNVLSESIIVCGDVEITPSRVKITGQGAFAEVLYDASQIKAVVEEFTADPSVTARWGHKLYRVQLRAICKTEQYALTYKIQ